MPSNNPWESLLIPKKDLPKKDIEQRYAKEEKGEHQRLFDVYGKQPQFNSVEAALMRVGVNPYQAMRANYSIVPKQTLPYGSGAIFHPSEDFLTISGKDGSETRETPRPHLFPGLITLPAMEPGDDPRLLSGTALHESGHVRDASDGVLPPIEQFGGPGHFTPKRDRSVRGPRGWNELLQKLIKQEDADRKEAKRRGLQSELPEGTVLETRFLRQNLKKGKK